MKQKIHEIADGYGFIPQSRQCVEECSELITAICKWYRKWDGSIASDSCDCKERTDIISEIADCKIMLAQLEYLLSAEDAVREIMRQKIERQMERMKNE